MKRILLHAAAIAAVSICFASCGAPAAPAAQTSGVSAAAPASSGASAEPVHASAAGEAGRKLFDGMLSALPEKGVLRVTDKNGTNFQVDASDEAVGKIWDLLLDQEFSPLEASDDLFKGPQDSISISFARDEEKYLIKLYGCGQAHPAYPGQTVVDLESHGEGAADFKSYIGGLAVFTEVSALVDQLRGTLKVVLNQPYVKLETGDLDGQILTAWLQMGNRFICAFTGESGSRVMLFDAETGDLLGTSRVVEPVVRMEPSRQESGFDYQVYTGSRIIYKNSKSPLEEKQYTPPIPSDHRGFSVHGGKAAWASGDGVHLLELESGEERLILAENELAGLAGALAPEGEPRMEDPRLMNDGEQLAVPVRSAGKLAGVVLVDLGNNGKTGFFDVFGSKWQSLSYPDKRTFAAAGESDVTVVNVTSGESKRLPFVHDGDAEWWSGDFSTFVVREPEEDTLFTSYLVSARKAGDRTREFVKAEGRGTFTPIGATERKFFAYADDDEGPRYLLINLKN